MKKFIKTFRVFFPDLYCILIPVLLIASIVLTAAFDHIGQGTIGVVIFSFILALADFFGDYLVFEGMVSKKFCYGLFRNSHEGHRVLRNGLLVDQARRFLMFAIYFIFAGFAVIGTDFKSAVIFALIATFGCYMLATIGLNVTRYLDSMMVYMMVASFVCGICCAGAAIGFLVASFPNAGILAVIVLFFEIVLSALATYIIVKHILYKFECGFERPDEEGEKFDNEWDGDKLSSIGKKKLWIFIAMAFGVNVLMGIFMGYGSKNNIDISNFMFALMMYPLCGVCLGKLIFDKNAKLPKAAYIIAVITTGIMMLISIASIIWPVESDLLGTGMTPYSFLSNLIIMPFSLAFFILTITCGKQKRKNAGMLHKNIWMVALLVCLFIVLYVARLGVNLLLQGIINDNLKELLEMVAEPWSSKITYTSLMLLPINYILTIIMFVGEEYGWRYYLQPIMQKKFGLRLGTVLLGLVWGLWHTMADLFYYTKDSGPQMLVSQIITCISIGIFFAYAYMKTQNIWTVVIMHFLNNNLIPIIEGNYSMDVLENQSVSWSYLPIALISAIPFILFICSSVFSKKEKVK